MIGTGVDREFAIAVDQRAAYFGSVPNDAGDWPRPPLSAPGMPPGIMPPIEDIMPEPITFDIIDCIEPPLR